MSSTPVSAWRSPCAGSNNHPAGIDEVARLRVQLAASRDPRVACQLAEIYCQQGAEADRSQSPCATDLYFRAAGYSWTAVQLNPGLVPTVKRSREIYHAALARMLVTAREDGRFQSGVGIQVSWAAGQGCLPLVPHSFPWKLDDFQELHPVGDYDTKLISRRQTRPGWGVPVVVRRPVSTGRYVEESYLTPRTAFAATVVLRPDVERWLAVEEDPTAAAVLEIHNPFRVASIDTDGVQTSLAADLSAPLAWSVIDTQESESPLFWFLEPDEVVDGGLFFLEPYQPGKIPVVFLHGLLSSPKTWVDLANDLRALPGFDQRFQVWAFRYATGREFLASAAHLRRDLRTAVATIDPGGASPTTRRMVLVGHSMGGLVAKLQVVSSGNELWNSVANQPIERIVTDRRSREVLAEAFYFEAVPFIRRVVFIATPHGGSSWAARPVGRLGACLARSDTTSKERFQQLVDDNPGVISPQAGRRLPTSIDLLNRKSELLQAVYRLQIGPQVRVHSVIGTGHWMCREGPADGVVPVTSARYPGAESECYVDATHTRVHRRPETVAEIARILRIHLAENGHGG